MTQTGATAQYLSSVNDTAAWGVHARLWSVVVGTKTASAVVTVYNGTSTSDPVVAVIDAATDNITHHFHGARFGGGIFVKLTGGAAKITVVAG